jgi:hypothetical protein
MPATAARTLTKRLIASPPFPALPTREIALKVTKLAGRRYFFVYILLLRGETAGECCSYRLQVGPHMLGQRRESYFGPASNQAA